MHCKGRAVNVSMIGMLLVGTIIGAIGHHLVAAQPSFTETVLLRIDLAGIESHELIVSRLETASGALEAQERPPQSLRPGIRIHANGRPISVELN